MFDSISDHWHTRYPFMLTRLLTLTLFTLSLSACGVLQEGTRSLDQSVRNLVDPTEPPEKPKAFARHEKDVGSVAMVNRAGKFVLVQTPRGTDLPKNVELFTLDQGGRRTSKIRLSPEKKSAVYVADIVQGDPAKGDRVVMEGMTDENGTIIWGTPTEDDSEPLPGDRIQVLE